MEWTREEKEHPKLPISLHLMQAEHGGLRLRLVVQQST